MSVRTPKRPYWFTNLSLDTQVARAQDQARQLLFEGINTYTRMDDSFSQRVITFVGREDLSQWYEGLNDAERIDVTDAIEAARAIGIALGLMLRGDVFAGGFK